MTISKIFFFKVIFASFGTGFVLAVFLIALLGWLNDIKEDKLLKELDDKEKNK